jgi:N-acetylneuraminic acid mutarotase
MKSFMSPSIASQRVLLSVAAAGLMAGGLLLGKAGYSQAAPQGSWATKSPIPAARNEVVAAVVNDKIYVLGGNFPRVQYDVAANEEYDPATDRWRSRMPIPQGLNHMAAAVLNGKIYTVGGFTGDGHKGANASVFEYDPAADTWRTLAPLSRPRGSVSAVAVDGKIHALGGRENETDVVAAHEIYDPAINTWSAGAPLPKARDHMVAVTVEGKIHAIGGRFGANEDMTNLHEVYDPKTNTWTSAPPLPTARGGGSGTLYRDFILVLGGEDDTRTYRENEGFDVKNNRWVTFAPLPAGRHGFGASTVGRSAYFISGAQGRGGRDVTDEVLVFTLP